MAASCWSRQPQSRGSSCSSNFALIQLLYKHDFYIKVIVLLLMNTITLKLRVSFSFNFHELRVKKFPPCGHPDTVLGKQTDPCKQKKEMGRPTCLTSHNTMNGRPKGIISWPFAHANHTKFENNYCVYYRNDHRIKTANQINDLGSILLKRCFIRWSHNKGHFGIPRYTQGRTCRSLTKGSKSWKWFFS